MSLSLDKLYLDDDLSLTLLTPAIISLGPSNVSQRNIDIVDDKVKFLSVNFKSVIIDVIFNSLRADFNIPEDYVIIRPNPINCIYNKVIYGELNGLDISRTLFYYG